MTLKFKIGNIFAKMQCEFNPNIRFILWMFLTLAGTFTILVKISKLKAVCDSEAMAEVYVEDHYDRNMALIFVDGVPSSGTTLMRAMLDAHPHIRCGQETHVIPRVFSLAIDFIKEKVFPIVHAAGVTREILNNAVAQFVLSIIVEHAEPAPHLCNKDPFILIQGEYALELFPNAKFIFMVRDGRATVNSIISRNYFIPSFNLSSFRQCLERWNSVVSRMYDQCEAIGRKQCRLVHYEHLVLNPAGWMKEILKYLDLPWNDAVLHHEEFINKPNGVAISKFEKSLNQVSDQIHTKSLTKWVGKLPDDVVRDMADIAPMLQKLGYDVNANPPDYAKMEL